MPSIKAYFFMLIVDAPGRFSITNCWPSRSECHWPISRARMSVVPGGRKRHYDAHRPRRIGLRAHDPRRRRQGGSACGQMQKLSAGKFHWRLPSLIVFIARA